MLDTATSALDAASGLLGGDDAPAEKITGTPQFTLGDSLDAGEGEGGVAAAPQNVNALDQGPVEFIHFGRVHADVNTRFIHGELDDLAHPVEEPGRGVMFRAALARETLLLYGFMDGLQQALVDYESSKGGAGELVGAAMDLLSGDEAPPVPKAADLDKHKEDAAACGGLVNVDAITYPDIHKAGMDLHQFRADYTAFADKVVEVVIKGDGEGGGELLGGLIPAMPGVTGAAKTVAGILFKPFDIFLGMTLNLRAQYEGDIEAQCHALSIKAIKEAHTPIFPIWFPEPPPAAEGEGEESGGGEGGGGGAKDPGAKAAEAVNEQIDKAKGAIDDVQEKVDGVRDDVRSFLGFEESPEPCYGDDALAAIFACFGERAVEGAPASAVLAVTTAFKDALGIGSLPGCVETAIDELTRINLGVLQRIYENIQRTSAKVAIDRASIMQIGREEMADQIIDLAARLIGTDLTDPDRSLLNVSGLGNITGANVKNIASGLLDDALGAQLAKVVDLANGALADVLEKIRTDAKTDNALTMEPFLARLPWLLALQVRNTFFPFWSLLVDKVFGSASGPLRSVMGSVRGIAGTANNYVTKAQDTLDTINSVKDNLAEGVDLMDAAKDPNAFKDKLLGKDNPLGGGMDEEAPPPAFPGAERLSTGAAAEITADDAEEVESNQKVAV